MAFAVKKELCLLGKGMEDFDYANDERAEAMMTSVVRGSWRNAKRSEFGFIATRKPDGASWKDHPIPIGNASHFLTKFFGDYSRWTHDIYWSPVTFCRPRRKAEFACRTKMSWADIDDSDPKSYRPRPGLLWETSPERYQGLWPWDRSMPAVKAEAYSKALTKCHGGDDGWSCTKVLRIPGSINHKPEYDEPFVRLLRADWTSIVECPKKLTPTVTREAVIVSSNHNNISCAKVLKKYRGKLHPKTIAKIKDKTAWEPDRSKMIFMIASDLHNAGASQDEIAAVLWVNPYFISKHGQDSGKLDVELSRILSKNGGANG